MSTNNNKPIKSRATPNKSRETPSKSKILGKNIPKIQVAVRKRPLFKKEKNKGEHDIVTVPDKYQLVVHEEKVKVDLTRYIDNHEYRFDYTFDEYDNNQNIYDKACKPLVNHFLNKGNATIFAYGQTGSGKTHTMMGPNGGKNKQTGIYSLAAQNIFNTIKLKKILNVEICVSFYEIYGGKLFDLLNKRNKVVCREDGQKNVHIVGLTETNCKNEVQLGNIIASGNSVRSTGQTGANVDSSRSHAILQLLARDKKSGIKYGKFSFIDLAGSERARDTTNNDRRTRLEGAEINKSLLALKECIRALDQNAGHRKFRGSKLTQVLKDSLTGNSKTLMIANISPNFSSCEHTLNTLRYADRVKELKNDYNQRKKCRCLYASSTRI